jgi:hypothetical protein
MQERTKDELVGTVVFILTAIAAFYLGWRFKEIPSYPKTPVANAKSESILGNWINVKSFQVRTGYNDVLWTEDWQNESGLPLARVISGTDHGLDVAICQIGEREAKDPNAVVVKKRGTLVFRENGKNDEGIKAYWADISLEPR